MFVEQEITSMTNPKVKNLVKLRKPNERRKQELFLIEGKRGITMALKRGVDVKDIYFGPHSDIKTFEKLVSDKNKLIPVSSEVFKKISYVKEESGFLALAYTYKHSLDTLIELPENPMILVLENVEKPGNLGAVIRTAVSAGVNAIVLTNMQTDIFNPNVIRASLGGIFNIKVIEAGRKEVWEWLKKKDFKIYATSTGGDKNYLNVDYNVGFALVLGSESQGLSSFWKDKAAHLLIVPMQGEISSLNISVSAAVIIYEALRKRESRQVI